MSLKVKLKESYSFKELADAGFLGSTRTLFRLCSKVDDTGKKRRGKARLKCDEIAYGVSRKRRSFKKDHIIEFVEGNENLNVKIKYFDGNAYICNS